MDKDILVAALGNSLMSDEGVGVAVLGRLSAQAARYPRVEFVDLASSAMRALHAMAGRRKAVFVDCALMGEEPGTIRRFTPEQVRSRKALSGLSLHEGDLLNVIELSRSLGECPEEVVIFGIQPQSIEPGEALSPALAARLEEYADLIGVELRGEGSGPREREVRDG